MGMKKEQHGGNELYLASGIPTAGRSLPELIHLLEVTDRDIKLCKAQGAILLDTWSCGMPGYFLGFQRLLNINPTKQTSENTRSSLHTPTVTQAMMTLGDQLFCRMKSHHRAQGWHKCWQEIIKLYSSRCNSRKDKWVGARREAAKMNRDCKTQ